MNIVWYPNECKPFIYQHQEFIKLRDIARNTHQSYIITDATETLNQAMASIEPVAQSITSEQNRLVYLVTNVENLPLDMLVAELDKSTRAEERLIILHQLCQLDIGTYGQRMETLVKNVTEQGGLSNDPFYVDILNSYPVLTSDTKEAIDISFANVTNRFREQATIALLAAIRGAFVNSSYLYELTADEFITYIDGYIDSICDTLSLDPMMFKSSIEYINFLLCNNMMEKLNRSIQWIDEHKEDAINIHSSTNTNTSFDILILINRMKHNEVLTTTLSDTSWNSKEMEVINSETADAITPYDELGFGRNYIITIFNWYNAIIISYK
jgi:hypothetical protein